MDKEQEELKRAAKQRLDDLLVNLEEATRFATTDLSGWDPRTAAGAMIRKREAEDQVTSLTSAYETLITNSFVKVFVSGPRAADFAASQDKKGFVTVDGTELYVEFAKVVEPSMDPKTRQFGTNELILLTQVMLRYMQQNHIMVLDQPKLDGNELDVIRPDFQSVVDIVRKSLRNGNGDTLLLVDLHKKVLAAALSKKVSDLMVPVIVFGVTADETQSLKTKLFGSQPSITIEATESSTDEDLAEEVESKIQSVLNPKKTTTKKK